jgi:hypothetical protein
VELLVFRSHFLHPRLLKLHHNHHYPLNLLIEKQSKFNTYSNIKTELDFYNKNHQIVYKIMNYSLANQEAGQL